MRLASNSISDTYRAYTKYVYDSYYLIRMEDIKEDYRGYKIYSNYYDAVYLRVKLAEKGIKNLENGTFICGKISDINKKTVRYSDTYVVDEIYIYIYDAYFVNEEELKKISKIDTDFYKSYLCKTKNNEEYDYYARDPFQKYYLFDKVDLSTENIFNDKQWHALALESGELSYGTFKYDYNIIYFNNNVATVTNLHNGNKETMDYSIKNGNLYLNGVQNDVRKISENFYIIYYNFGFLNPEYLILFDGTEFDCNNIK